MKLSLVVVLAIFAVTIFAVATEATSVLSDSPIDSKIDRVGPILIRQKRFTCDLLSFGARGLKGWNHAACATKCTATGHKGGHCNNADCKCGKKWRSG